MALPDKSRYRRVEYIGARILQARELNKMQRIVRHLDDTGASASFQDNAVYRQGATLNVTVGIVNKDVTLSATDPAKPMLVFVGRTTVPALAGHLAAAAVRCRHPSPLLPEGRGGGGGADTTPLGQRHPSGGGG